MSHSKVTVHFADGTDFSEFTEFTFREKFSDPIDTLTFKVAPTAKNRQTYLTKLQKGELVTLQIDDKPKAAMMLQSITRSVSPSDGVTIEVEAVSPIKLLYESSVDVPAATKALSSDRPVIEIIDVVSKPFGFTWVTQENDASIADKKTGKQILQDSTAHKKRKRKKATPQYNESCFQFINRILACAGVICRCDPTNASLYITAPHYSGNVAYSVKQAASGSGPKADRFFGPVHVTDTNEEQYSFCEVIGISFDEDAQTSTAKPRARKVTTDINSTRPPFRASGPFPYKPAFFKDDDSESGQTADVVALHVLGRRAETAFTVKGMVQGFASLDGTPWTIDTICRVYVEALGIDEEMWVSEVTLTQAASGGQRTELTLIPKGYYIVGKA